MARRHVLCGALLVVAAILPAQELVTAQRFFEQVSQAFGALQDYTCRFTYARGDTVSTGTLYYKSPNLLRLDYATPADQVILMDGKTLQIYIPSANLILAQELRTRTAAELETLAGGRALTMLQEGYDIAYLDTPDPVPLEPDSTTLVTKLRLTRRVPREMYREIVLSVGEDNMIRRMQGILEDETAVVMDYTGIRVNQGISETRFREEEWADANRVDNFLTGGD